MSDHPKVSALITVYNGEEHIQGSIGSLQRQTLDDVEILVIDDLSDDRTVEIIRSIDDRRIRLICSAERLGRARALEFGCREARGEYIAILDADDYAYPERLERQARFLDEHPDHVWVGSAEERVDLQRSEHVVRQYPLDDRAIRRMASKCIPYCHSAIMFRRSLITRGINYDPSQPYLIDFEFFLRVARWGKAANLPEPLARRHIRDASYFQRSFTRQAQNRRLAWFGLKSIWAFRTPPWLAIHPVVRLGYPLMPQVLQRQLRRLGGINDKNGSV